MVGEKERRPEELENKARKIFEKVRKLWDEYDEYNNEIINVEQDLEDVLVDYFEIATGKQVDWVDWCWNDIGTTYAGFVTTKDDKKYVIYIDENGIEIKRR